MAVPSLPALIQNLPDALLGDAKDLCQRRYRLAFFVASANLSIAFAFGGSPIGYRELREF
jgi:hypothetical protein